MGADGDSSEHRVEGGGDGEEKVSVNIRCSNGSKFSVRTSLEFTVGTFKSILAQNCDIPADQQRLIYKGRILKDDQTLASYGMFFLLQIFFFFWVLYDKELSGSPWTKVWWAILVLLYLCFVRSFLFILIEIFFLKCFFSFLEGYVNMNFLAGAWINIHVVFFPNFSRGHPFPRDSPN